MMIITMPGYFGHGEIYIWGWFDGYQKAVLID